MIYLFDQNIKDGLLSDKLRLYKLCSIFFLNREILSNCPCHGVILKT